MLLLLLQSRKRVKGLFKPAQTMVEMKAVKVAAKSCCGLQKPERINDGLIRYAAEIRIYNQGKL